jgi:hypothetical protein
MMAELGIVCSCVLVTVSELGMFNDPQIHRVMNVNCAVVS